MNQSSM